ncbi:hypothetical protein Mapa_004500 [Marchantia paleacea]|nr:hypothetical protein Mapa_004500 [Marchantia paleacea]
MVGLGLRELGATGLKVSCLGFGASPLGSVFGNKVTEEDAIASVNEAVRLGINFFDCSPYYGDTLAETMLGKCLKALPVPREQYVLSTKVGRYGAGFDFSADRVTASVDESLKRLNVDYIDVIQCHDIEFAPLDQIISETIPALQKLKEAGKVRFIGITGLPLKIYHYVLDRVPPGTVDVVLSYCHYCLNDNSLLNSLPYLKSKGVGVISASPLSMGLLTPQGPPDWHPAPQKLKDACATAAAHCQSKGKDITKLALQYSLSNPDIATVLVGMCSVEQVRSNVQAALEVSNGLDSQLLDEVDSILQPVKNLSWPMGRDENN